ncbi:thioredoxin fold domain-containing protein [Neptunomonas sp.]|uniref:thioredoxin family protein n=1 Tax=Neptunomonas sp. TaxID=1971898 RepID=UPI0025CCE13A|nr:thioredoxin fold domain-containing protein [Neptunomonas sp.]
MNKLIHYITALVSCAALSVTQAGELPAANNFLEDAKTQGKYQVSIVMISQRDCSYCELIHNDFLDPMYKGGHYAKKVLFREVMIDSNRVITDANGQDISPKRFARRYSANLTPTLLFLDRKGKTLVPNMVGVNTPEFYGYYLDQSIDKAIKVLKDSSK